MSTLVVPWFLLPLVLGLVSLGCGFLVEWAGGRRLAGELLVPAGLALVVVLGLFTTSLSATAFLTIPVVLGASAGGYVLAIGRPLGRVPAGAAAALATYLVYAAPVVLTGRATFTGYVKLDDTASFLGFTDQIMRHGRDYSSLLPSTFQQLQRVNIGEGYPVGTFVPLGIGRRLVGTDAAWAFPPTTAFFAAAGALTLFALLRPLVAPAWARAAIAFVAAQAALLYGYSLWGGIKEVAAFALLGLTAALVPLRREELTSGRALLPFAVAVAATLGVLSVSGGLWIVLLALPALVAVGRGGRRLGRPAAVTIAVAAVLSIPTLAVARAFLHYGTSNLFTPSQRLGNLIRPLDFAQVLGIWITGDFRLDPANVPVTAVLLAVCALAALAGAAYAVRRGAWRVPLLAATCVLAAAVLRLESAPPVGKPKSSPWLVAKALAEASPFVVLLALVGAAALFAQRRRVEGAVVAAAIAVGVLWSNVYAYSAVWVAPRAQLGELEQIGKLYAGDGPTLMTEYQPYGVRHFLRDMQSEGASELRVNLVPLTNGRPLDTGATADLDQFKYPDLLYYRTLVLRTSGSESRPAAPYRLLFHGRYYDVWQRPEGADADVLVHVPLGSFERPSAVPACSTVRDLAQVAAGDHAQLAAARTPDPVVVPLSASTFPAGWYPDASQPETVTPMSDGTATIRVRVPAAGGYSVWLGGFALRTARVAVDGREVGRVRASGSGEPGIQSLAGNIVLAAGAHTVSVSYGDPWWRPGATAPAYGIGPVVLAPITGVSTVTYVQPAQADTLCGRSLDWLEVVRRPA